MDRNRFKRQAGTLGFAVLMLAASISGCRGVTKVTDVPAAVTMAGENASDVTQTLKQESSTDVMQTVARETSSDVMQTTTQETFTEERYSNPIDAYFLPRLNGHIAASDLRTLQDTYRGVWKAEFDNIMLWMQDKCVYQVDKDNLSLFADSVESMIDASRTVILTDILDDYKRPPDDPARNSWGTGTRSGLSQKEAEIYRDAGMLLIDDNYVFLDKDYSLEHYE